MIGEACCFILITLAQQLEALLVNTDKHYENTNFLL